MSKYRKLTAGPGQILVLRTCNADMTSYNGFRWPESGPVEAPDWKPTYKCGHGLHGLPWGYRHWNGLNIMKTSKWLCVLVSTDKDNYRHGKKELVDKCKFRRAEDVSVGTFQEVYKNILDEGIRNGVKPTADGMNYLMRSGYAECLRVAIKAGVLPTARGVEWAMEYGHTECVAIAQSAMRDRSGC